jgi:hypothetical protein
MAQAPNLKAGERKCLAELREKSEICSSLVGHHLYCTHLHLFHLLLLLRNRRFSSRYVALDWSYLWTYYCGRHYNSPSGAPQVSFDLEKHGFVAWDDKCLAFSQGVRCDGTLKSDPDACTGLLLIELTIRGVFPMRQISAHPAIEHLFPGARSNLQACSKKK